MIGYWRYIKKATTQVIALIYTERISSILGSTPPSINFSINPCDSNRFTSVAIVFNILAGVSLVKYEKLFDIKIRYAKSEKYHKKRMKNHNNLSLPRE